MNGAQIFVKLAYTGCKIINIQAVLGIDVSANMTQSDLAWWYVSLSFYRRILMLTLVRHHYY